MREQPLRPLDVSAVEVDDEFWSPIRETNREETISHQYERIDEGGCLENFRRVRDGETGGFRGMVFEDSDAYKWLEAASYVLASREDPALRERVDRVVDLVASAQADDGYLNTFVQLRQPDRRWTNIRMVHELYCAGHLIEAAVAHHRATGDRALLDVATAFADHVDDVFGPDGVEAAPGHQEIELALVKLYRETGEDRYLDLAEFFVEVRGRNDRFDWETDHPEEIAGLPDTWHVATDWDPTYYQSQAPVREQEAVEGHSVRAMYLYCGAADVAAETGDEELFAALEGLWENMTEKRTYVTGGIGSTEHGERFTEDYDLPNDTAYAETCAAIGSVFWNRRLFEHTGAARYADLSERTLYNGVLVGTSLDGTEYFYDNRLASDGDVHRSGWFECACCPPNFARLVAGLERHLYASDGDTLYVTQYVGSTAEATLGGTEVTVDVASDFPWDGEVTLTVDTAEPATFDLALRVPEWCADARVAVDGDPVDATAGEFAVLSREWTGGETVTATFEMSPRLVAAHPAVEADVGRVAMARGPVVYCLEAADHDVPVDRLRLSVDADLNAERRPDLLGGVTTLSGQARVPADWDGDLYRDVADLAYDDASLTAVPYYAWDNRENGAMRVWVPTPP
ncbi:MAG: glycoside hydrolase family 127 protein [Halobacteriaceae archaeon]